MGVSLTDRFTVRDAAELYGLDGWGNGYFHIGESGNLLVTPHRNPEPGIDVHAVVRELAGRGLKTPVLLRFPQLLEAQVRQLTSAFAAAIEEFRYPARFLPVFPAKVNQQRAVIEGLLESGRAHGLGIEVGSRPELLAAAALDMPPEALVVCNGFKDREYLAAAELACRVGKRVVVVVEKPFELDTILAMGDEAPRMLGFRIRLQARGSGLWEKSGGYASKFGLTTLQLLAAVERLRQAGQLDRVALLHFHIGSQITEIRKIKVAITEASRIYCKLRKLDVPVQFVDVGGGLGVDYDGSRTSSDASVNYSVQEYANDVVFGIAEVCQQEQVPPPHVACESGRWLTAYHSMLVADVRGAISASHPEPPEPRGDEPRVIQDLVEVARTISVKNYREFYHDALEYRDQMYSLFNLGLLGLEDRAKGEGLFWYIAGRAVRFSKSAKFVAEEFDELESKLHDKLICNFSVFQSLPDHWALDQLFPVLPIHRLNERPTRRASLVDITCDSDGEVSKFVDLKDIKEALETHPLIPGEPYYLAFLLIGAYQDTMGDLHNLFGRVHEAEAVLDGSGRTVLRSVTPGEQAIDALEVFGFGRAELLAGVARALAARTAVGAIDGEEAERLLSDYTERLGRYPYMD